MLSQIIDTPKKKSNTVRVTNTQRERQKMTIVGYIEIKMQFYGSINEINRNEQVTKASSIATT